MPRKRRAQAAQPTDAQVAQHLPEQSDPSTEFDPAKLEALPPSPPPSDTEAKLERAEAAPVVRSNDVESPAQPKRFGLARDSKSGIRIDKEHERKVGIPYPRVLISFRDDAIPTPEERQLLKDEGFRFDGASWGKELTGANVLLAKKTVNRIYTMRGEDYQLFIG